MAQLARHIFVATWTIGWFGVASALLIYERASYLAWRLWPIFILVVALVWIAMLVKRWYRLVPERLADEAREARKRKWLNWGKTKSKDRKRSA